jgi:hypothetical protein
MLIGRAASVNQVCNRTVFFPVCLLCYKRVKDEFQVRFPRNFMNADLRRRTDEVVNRLTQLRDSL